MPTGTIERDGTVTITFNCQGEMLEAPGHKKYLPCDGCGNVEAVELFIIAHLCLACGAQVDESDEGTRHFDRVYAAGYAHAAGYRE